MQMQNKFLGKNMAQNVATQDSILLMLTVLALSLYFIILKQYLKSKSQSKSQQLPLPPGPFPWPILGNILQLGNNPHVTLTRLAHTYGPLFSLRLGTQLVVVGSTKEAASEILRTHDRVLSGRSVPHVAPAKSSELNHLSLGWVVECNDKWRALRAICRTELFSSKAIESQSDLREKKVMEMLGYVGGLEGKVVRVRDVAFAVVFNMMSNILVSRDLISTEDERMKGQISRLISDIMQVAVAPNVSDFYPILGRFDLQKLRKKSMGFYDRFCRIYESIINERRERESGGDDLDHAPRKQDFLDALINHGYPNDQINMLLLELLSAGTDTSSSTIEWTMAEMIKNPEIMKRVRDELGKEINESQIKETHLSRLTYLQACVRETLRLHPTGPFLLPHRAVETCEVMNYTIPKDSQVLVNFWAIGRDPKIWEDPLVFKPERFLNSNLDFLRNDFEFIPFGAGRRICPGLPMASKHVPLVVAALVHFFDWSLPNGKDPNELNMREKYGLTVMKEHPLLLIPKARK